jgi:hypothetical protein
LAVAGGHAGDRVELLSGKPVVGRLVVAAGSVAVVKEPRSRAGQE